MSELKHSCLSGLHSSVKHRRAQVLVLHQLSAVVVIVVMISNRENLTFHSNKKHFLVWKIQNTKRRRERFQEALRGF